MRILITGSTGFVGRNFLLHTLASNRYGEIILPVRSLEKLRAQFLGDGFEDVPAQVRPVVGSARDWNLKGIGKVDHVVHSAGLTFSLERKAYFKVNVEGTLELLRQLESPGKVLILSSQAASGPCPDHAGAKSESDLDSPVNWYGESKLEMEKQVASAFSEINFLFIRPPMILGPRDTLTLPLFKMVKNPLHFKPGLKPKYYSFISVTDLCEAMSTVLHSNVDWKKLPHRHYFVTSDNPITDHELIAGTAEASSRSGVVLPIPQPLLKVVAKVIDAVPFLRTAIPTLSRDRAKDLWPDRWVASPEKFKSEFGWHPKESLEMALRATFDWYSRTGQL